MRRAATGAIPIALWFLLGVSVSSLTPGCEDTTTDPQDPLGCGPYTPGQTCSSHDECDQCSACVLNECMRIPAFVAECPGGTVAMRPVTNAVSSVGDACIPLEMLGEEGEPCYLRCREEAVICITRKVFDRYPSGLGNWPVTWPREEAPSGMCVRRCETNEDCAPDYRCKLLGDIGWIECDPPPEDGNCGGPEGEMLSLCMPIDPALHPCPADSLTMGEQYDSDAGERRPVVQRCTGTGSVEVHSATEENQHCFQAGPHVDCVPPACVDGTRRCGVGAGIVPPLGRPVLTGVNCSSVSFLVSL